MADPRETLGRILHETRLACEAERAEAEGRQRFHLGSWEERSEHQRELDMRIGHAVANYALEQNALTWDTTCNGCAGLLDSGYTETIRRETAEAKLSAIADRIARVAPKGAYLTPEQELAEDLLDILTGKEAPS